MSLPILFRALARAEYDTAITWYDQARPGLGTMFEEEVQAVLDTAAATPERYPIAELDVRETPLRGFPYCLYYRVRLDKLIVVAVYHQSRDPSGWRGRS